MDATHMRQDSFVLPGEDPDQLVQTTQKALAAVPQMVALVQQGQTQVQQQNQVVAQQQQMIQALLMNVQQLTMQLQKDLYAPVLPKVLAESGVLQGIGNNFITDLTAERVVDLQNNMMRESLTIRASANEYMQGQAAIINAEANLNSTRNIWKGR